MQAVVWHGRRDVRVEEVPEPRIEAPTDAIVRVTSSAISGADVHLYDVPVPLLTPGDVLGQEPMGVVEEVGREVVGLAVGDRVVIPANIACGHCWMCAQRLYAHCETGDGGGSQDGTVGSAAPRPGARLAGGQAGALRVGQAQFGPIRVPDGPPDERFLFLSDVLPAAWQAVEYADVRPGGTVAVLGLGPVGQMAARIASRQGAAVIGVDLLPERLAMAHRHGVATVDRRDCPDLPGYLRELTEGRGPDAVIDAGAAESPGASVATLARRVAGLVPAAITGRLHRRAGADRPAFDRLAGSDPRTALLEAVAAVRRGGTVSICGFYGGSAHRWPMRTLFEKGVTLRMGHAHVRQWIEALLPLVLDDADPLGTGDLVTHRLPLRRAPAAYELLRLGHDGAITVVLRP